MDGRGDGTYTATGKQAKLSFGVIGYGYWGPQLVRNLDHLPNGRVDCIADRFPHRREAASLEHPLIAVVDDAEPVLASDVQAVVIATPIRTHFQLAKAALERGKH